MFQLLAIQIMFLGDQDHVSVLGDTDDSSLGDIDWYSVAILYEILNINDYIGQMYKVMLNQQIPLTPMLKMQLINL